MNRNADIMIEARNLTKHYGDVQALKGISFEVRRGEVLGFLGPNGAGKTTTMKILTCFIAPTEGTALVNGCDIFEDSLGARASLGYLPESTPLYTEMMVTEYLDFVARMRKLDPRKAIDRALEQTGLTSVAHKEIRTLSKGYRQRVGLAQALIHQPPILILDEPLSGLDPNQASEIRELIKEIGRERTVILSTHNLAEVQMSCNRVLIVAKGELVADDTPDNLRSQTGQTFLRVSFKLQEGQTKEKVRHALNQVRGVTRIEIGDEEGQEVALHVFTAEDADVRAQVFQTAVEGGFTLVGVEEQTEDLGSVFRQLTTTKEERAEADARMQARSQQLQDDEVADEPSTENDATADDEESGDAEEGEG